MPVDWHLRYQQQATWTKQIRRYLYQKVNSCQAKFILEVGCGTGAILNDHNIALEAIQVGLDINFSNLISAKKHIPNAYFTNSDAHFLPFPDRTFDFSFCHFLLLWVTDPVKVIQEMKRVTRGKGAVLAMAEPDYNGRIDFPEILETIGTMQTKSLILQGAKPSIGRELKAIFAQAGLVDVEVGILGGQWGDSFDKDAWELEWEVIKYDLADLYPKESLDNFQHLDYEAWKNHQRILYIPTFYAFGRNL